MALQNLEFEFESENTQTINPEWSHMGVTGSGDLEVMFTKKDLGGKVQAKVCTPVVGFDAVWEKMLGKSRIAAVRSSMLRHFGRYAIPSSVMI